MIPVEDDTDDDKITICGCCDGTGEAGRFGQLVCRPCKGSGEVLASESTDDFDDWYDGSDREHAEYLRSDR